MVGISHCGADVFGDDGCLYDQGLPEDYFQDRDVVVEDWLWEEILSGCLLFTHEKYMITGRFTSEEELP